MEKRLWSFLAVCLMTVSMAFAQQKVTGVVIESATGEPVVGASVLVMDANGVGSATDINGKFTINNVPSSAKRLMVSYIGMVTKEVAIKPNLTIYLDSDSKVLNEQIVVAYGTQKKSTFTGSAAVVGGAEIEKVQVTNAVDALKGKAAGVQINTASGQPGSTPTIRIRGVNSINAGSAPLIVLDGSPYDGGLNNINPVDVESITVLKDAASTALYGARGGNGVILITTKSGKNTGNASITVDAKWGSNSKATPNYRMVTSPAKYYELWYQNLYNYALSTGNDDMGAWRWANENLIPYDGWDYEFGLGYNVYTIPEGQAMIGQNGKLNPNATLGYMTEDGFWMIPDNWTDETYHNALRQEYTISANASTDKSTFYASVNYLDNEGITQSSDYKRFTGRLKTDYKLKPWLKVGANLSYGHYNRNYLGDDGESGSSGNVFALTNIAPIYPMYIRGNDKSILYDENAHIQMYDYGDGEVNGVMRPYLSQSNPLSANQLDTRNTEGNTFNGTATIDVTLPYGFTLTSLNNVYLNEYRFTNVTNPYYGQYASSNGIVSKEHDRAWSYNYQQRLAWHQIYGVHDIEAMVGHEYYRDFGYELDYYMTNMFSQSNKELAGAVVPGSGSSYTTDYNNEAWFGRGQYNFDEKYFGSVSLRREASSRFAKKNRWGTFWSIGAGWLINKENFFKADWVDELKFKISYGENGNDDIGSYRFTPTYDIVNSNNSAALLPNSLGKEEISWEKNAKFNVGFDFSLFGGRLTGSAEFYANKTHDMLSWFPLAPSYGYTGYYANVGDMLNNGLEFDLKGDIIRSSQLKWSAYMNLTTNHNEITRLPDERKTYHVDGSNIDGYSSGNYFYGEGISRYTYFTKKYAGVDKTTGQSLFYMNEYAKNEDGTNKLDANGNKIVTGQTTTTNYQNADYYLCGDMLPDVYGGFGTSVEWKGFDFSIDFQYQLGGKVYDSTYAALMSGDQGYGMHVDILNAWTPDNTKTNVPHLQYGDDYIAARSNRFLTSASYLTLQNITLGYTLPRNWTAKMGVQKIRLYAVADNIWTWSKRQGLDPRQSITGANTNAYYSSIRTISGGITVTF